MKIRLLTTSIAAAVLMATSAFAQSAPGGGSQPRGTAPAGPGLPGQVLRLPQHAPSASLTVSPAVVREVQQALNRRGYNAGRVDGVLGPRTSQALQNFQQAQGIEPTGTLNQKTFASLGIHPAAGSAAGGGGGYGGGALGGYYYGQGVPRGGGYRGGYGNGGGNAGYGRGQQGAGTGTGGYNQQGANQGNINPGSGSASGGQSGGSSSNQ